MPLDPSSILCLELQGSLGSQLFQLANALEQIETTQ